MFYMVSMANNPVQSYLLLTFANVCKFVKSRCVVILRGHKFSKKVACVKKERNTFQVSH